MSHIAVRILANHLADATLGVNAVAALVPRLNNDDAPGSVTVYDETRDAFAARRRAPREDEAISFPAIVVYCQRVTYDGGVGQTQPTQTPGQVRCMNGAVTLAVEVLVNTSVSEDAITEGMYLLRAVRGSIAAFDEPENEETLRTAAGVQLKPSSNEQQGQAEPFSGNDTIVSAGALILTYAFTESLPFA